jgi:glycosyltransferase involved in cell wall biosynthesis
MTLARRSVGFWSDPGLRKKMGKAARELAVNKYDWSRVGDAIEAVYRRLVNQ